MNDCIFCKIVKKELPCYKVYEDEDFLGFLDIYPMVEGHTLLIPKKHYRFVYDVPNFDRYWLAALKITNAMKKVFSPYFITYLTYGLEVPHAHIHILPRSKEETNFVPEQKRFSQEKFKKISEKLQKELLKDY